ncbi:VWA domain-containing protein [Pseudomonas sp. SM4]|jgi:stress response protein SCP2|uniref:VWA domain-containing protein n=1 Tax=Pseudomonas sp. SM4 TaxID=3424177 RepID=UPI003F7AE485
MQITQGQRLPLSNILQGQSLTLAVQIQSSDVIDFVCFGVDAQGKLSDDRYMVFFNQPSTPCAGVKIEDQGRFQINLAQLPATIDRLVFTASIDGAGAMSAIGASQFSVSNPAGQTVAQCAFSGATFSAEKAIMVAELYRKNGEWRLLSNLQGYAQGLDALVNHFGGEVAESPAPAPVPAPAPAKVSLEKKIAAAAPHLVSLAKKAQISLEKANLTQTKARVVLVLDASGSMNHQYAKGRVQEVVDRLLPLAVSFDEDGELDCWAFGAKPLRLSPVTLSNHKGFIDSDSRGWRNWELGSRINDEPKVIEKVLEQFHLSDDGTPMYVLFISDGGVSESRKITRLMVDAANLPIFWQFVGLGGKGYGILEKLDTLPGRVVDNCGFFALDDLHDISEEQLYDLLMAEFPIWLKDAKAKGIIR